MGVVDLYLPVGGMCRWREGRMEVCDGPMNAFSESVGPLAAMLDEQARVAWPPKSKIIFFPLFEVAVNPLMEIPKGHSLAKSSLQPLRDMLCVQGRKSLDREIRSLTKQVRAERGATVWRFYHESGIVELPADEQPNKIGAVVFCQVAMASVKDCLVTWEEKKELSDGAWRANRKTA